MEVRLHKFLARAGLTSRRGAERLILAGRVKVNGRVVYRLGLRADPDKDLIEVDDRPVTSVQAKAYYIFHKPAGYLTTLRDPRGRPTVAPFISNLGPRVFPVGRLDMDAEGLLILTNDGELAARLMHPRYHVPKIYRVKVKGLPSAEALDNLAAGRIMLGDRPAAPAEVEVIKKGRDRTWLKLTLIEGRRRQIKRMCSQVGHPVLKLKRIAYGPLKLGRLAEGKVRPLKPAEVKALKAAAEMDACGKKGGRPASGS